MESRQVFVAGRFRGLKRAEVVMRLTWNGHAVVRRLQAADAVLVGTGVRGDVLAEAAERGLAVFGAEALAELAPHALPDPSGGASAAEPKEKIPPRERILEIAAQPYWEWAWSQLVTQLGLISVEEAAEVVPRIEAAVWRWPAHERYLQKDWLVAALDGQDEPRLRLGGNLILTEVLKERPVQEVRRLLERRAEWMPGVRQLRINHSASDLKWMALLEPDLLAGLAEFDFMYNGFGTKGLRRVLDAIPRAKTTVLDLRSANLGQEGAEMLAQAGLTSLRWLQLYQNDIKDGGLRALCGQGTLPSLEYLVVDYNHLTAKAGEYLARAPFAPRMAGLKIKYNDLRAAGAQALSRGPWHALERLDLSANEIGDEGLSALLVAPALGKLSRLDIEGNSVEPLVTDAGMQALAESPGLPALRELHLQLNRVTATGFSALLSSPHRRALKVLGIQNNNIEADRVQVLERADLPVRLEALRINFFGEASAAPAFYQTLSKAAALEGLRRLFISPPWSFQKKTGTATALLKNPALQGIETLELWECRFDDAAMRLLVRGPFSNLRRLSMTNCGLSDRHLLWLSQAPWLDGLQALTISDYPKLGDVSPLKARLADAPTIFVAF